MPKSALAHDQLRLPLSQCHPHFLLLIHYDNSHYLAFIQFVHLHFTEYQASTGLKYCPGNNYNNLLEKYM